MHASAFFSILYRKSHEPHPYIISDEAQKQVFAHDNKLFGKKA